MIKTIFFGGGNFQRAFSARFLQLINNAGYDGGHAVVVRPTNRGKYQLLESQNWKYQLWVRGVADGNIVDEWLLIDCIKNAVYPYEDFTAYLELARLPSLQTVFSNTTEAGIRFVAEAREDQQIATEFPAKLTQLLYARWIFFSGDPAKGLDFLPCELTENNGRKLANAVIHYAMHWGMEHDFIEWIGRTCTFSNTLVDSIVPGAPATHERPVGLPIPNDEALVCVEPYHLLVIENAPKRLKDNWPFKKAGLNVIMTDDLEGYRTLKVRLLNGAHTAMVPVGLVNDIKTVGEFARHDYWGDWLKRLLYNNIIPSLEGVEQEEAKTYTRAVIDRFLNPFAHHRLESILLNSLSKWPARLGDTILYYRSSNVDLPAELADAWTCQKQLILERNPAAIPDDPVLIKRFKTEQPDTPDKWSLIMADAN